jgi:hypothetical protein
MKKRIVVAVAIALLVAGSVTFAQQQGRAETYRFTLTETAMPLGSCGDFNIVWDDVVSIHGVLKFDKNGDPVKRVEILKIIGQAVYYNSSNPDKFILGGPGEGMPATYMYEDGVPTLILFKGLLWKVMLKGYGHILMETGYQEIDLQTGELLVATGHNQVQDQDLAALCDYLK